MQYYQSMVQRTGHKEQRILKILCLENSPRNPVGILKMTVQKNSKVADSGDSRQQPKLPTQNGHGGNSGPFLLSSIYVHDCHSLNKWQRQTLLSTGAS